MSRYYTDAEAAFTHRRKSRGMLFMYKLVHKIRHLSITKNSFRIHHFRPLNSQTQCNTNYQGPSHAREAALSREWQQTGKVCVMMWKRSQSAPSETSLRNMGRRSCISFPSRSLEYFYTRDGKQRDRACTRELPVDRPVRIR